MNRHVEFVPLKDYKKLIDDVSKDETIEKSATHLVYMTSANNPKEIEEKIIYSILRKQPKRADIYWFIHVDVTDEPHTQEYMVTEIKPNKMFRIDLRLGFREIPRINKYFREIVTEMKENKEVNIISRYPSLLKHNISGDFRFVVMKKFLASENEFPFFQQITMNGYFLLKWLSLSEEKGFGLDSSNVEIEKVPVLIAPPKAIPLKRKY